MGGGRISGNKVMGFTVDADDIFGHGDIEQMVADEMEGFDAIGSRHLQLLNGVNLVVHEAQALYVAHIGKHVLADGSQVGFLDAQQLLIWTIICTFTFLLLLIELFWMPTVGALLGSDDWKLLMKK